MTPSAGRLVGLSWFVGVPGTLAQVLGFELLQRGSSAAYLVLLAGTGLVAVGISLVCRARNLSAWWSLIAVFPVIGFLFREFWLLDRLKDNDGRAA
jgi:hypothetical protein